MFRSTRIAAAFLLALLLPVQGLAAVCAQICAQTQQERHAQAQAAHAEEGAQEAADHHCADSDMGAGKCCHAHTFLIDVSVPGISGAPAAAERASFVARWTNFIPEEPSPPPIPVLRSA